ncbi:MAG: phage tail protein [Tabrizicola sp.]
MNLTRVLPILIALVALPAPADAAPLFAAISTFATTVGAAIKASVLLQVLTRVALSVALSALQRALMPKPRDPGIKTKVTQTGDTNPQAFPLHKVATAGTHACPPMTHGTAGRTPNHLLNYVIVLSDVPGATLSRWMINNEYVTLGATPHPDYGLPATGKYSGHAWIKVYDGSQTTADPMLLSRYTTGNSERPWSADMIGRGLVYAICTFRFNRELFPGLPRCKFELNGIPLYDPRQDSTVGGSGAHRWNDRATWEPSLNPQVGIYNLLRGIELPDGSVYGGGFPAEDVPLSSWFAAMNECDLAVTNGAGTEPQFRAGIEATVDEEPADLIAELLKACSGNLAEIGGLWKTRAGPPGTPVYMMTDADIVSSSPQEFKPFPNMADSYNGAHATYPDPGAGWEPAEAEPYYSSDYEQDDRGFRLTADLNLVACPFASQVRRLMYAYVEGERRFRRHELTLPPDGVILEPLDAISWTSSWNGYASKLFEIAEVAEDMQSGLQRVSLIERDPADYSYPALPGPDPISTLPDVPPPQTLPAFAVSGASIGDDSGNPRRPALSLTWEPELFDVYGINYEVRLQATGAVVARGSTQAVAAGSLLVTEGVLASTVYEVRAQPVADRATEWTSWLPATTPATLITSPDLAEGSVSIQLQTVVLGPFTRATIGVGTVLATLAIGQIAPGQGWERRVHFEGKGGNLVGTPFFTVALQRAKAILGGGLGPWETINTYEVFSAAWDVYASSGSVAGSYDDLVYRLVVTAKANPSRGTWPDSSETIRNVYMTAVRITK